MRNFILGIIVGIVISVVGFSGIAKLLDKGINKIKEVSVEISK
jgi:capsular polysaccharide biosynthesis protein